jgi:DNA-binding NtrC family response regulator
VNEGRIALAGVPVEEHRCRLLAARGFAVVRLATEADLAASIGRSDVVLAVVGVALDPASSSVEVLRRLRQVAPDLGLVLLVTHGSEALAVAAFRAGANDYLSEPCLDREFVDAIDRCWQRVRLAAASASRADAKRPDTMIGNSEAIRAVRGYLDRVARSDTSVLITGETGVGKELVADHIHSASARHRRPYVAINCAAIPESLLESELFGYERGAFTGADVGRDGMLKSADGGTIFLDEVGDMGLPAQAKILRALESKEVHRLGGRRGVPLDMRVIAATNQDLERLTSEGKFRRDLFYRLNVARVHVPPLRDRKEDLLPLLDYYLKQFNRVFHRHVEGFTPDALDCLHRHSWPGNIRELKNLVEAIFVNLNGHRITYIDLPEPFRHQLERAQTMSHDEREMLLSALFATNWNKSRAAQELRWSRMTLYRKIAKYHVSGEPQRRKIP